MKQRNDTKLKFTPSSFHGAYRHPLYATWNSMMNRCRNPSNPAYALYGARGISVCPEWEDFAVFIADMGDRPSSRYSIDRIDNDGNYCKENCRWSNRKTQGVNKRSTRIFSFDGESLCVSDWAKKIGVSNAAMVFRLNHWPIERALTELPNPCGKRAPKKAIQTSPKRRFILIDDARWAVLKSLPEDWVGRQIDRLLAG